MYEEVPLPWKWIRSLYNATQSKEVAEDGQTPEPTIPDPSSFNLFLPPALTSQA